MDDWDQFQHQMDLDIPENLDLNEICKLRRLFTLLIYFYFRANFVKIS